MRKEVKFSALVGLTLVEIGGAKKGSETIEFKTLTGEFFELTYFPDCCANCRVEDICGDINDIIGSPILLAEEVFSHKNPEGIIPEYQDSFTWTFYKLSTIKGSVTIRWYGESNGYYSETASFIKKDSCI